MTDNLSPQVLPDRLLTETEAADRLSISVKTLRRWRWAGHPPNFLKLGASVRYDPAVLAAYLADCCRASTSDSGPREVTVP